MFKIHILSLLLLFICCGQNILAADCDDSGACTLPGASSQTDDSVLSPVGKSWIQTLEIILSGIKPHSITPTAAIQKLPSAQK